MVTLLLVAVVLANAGWEAAQHRNLRVLTRFVKERAAVRRREAVH